MCVHCANPDDDFSELDELMRRAHEELAETIRRAIPDDVLEQKLYDIKFRAMILDQLAWW